MVARLRLVNRRIGIIGTGEIAANHARALGVLGVEVVAFSRSEQGRAAFRRAHGVRTVRSIEALLAAVDIVDICTPTDTHAGFGVDAARAGRQVICEKPLARTLPQARQLIAACDRAGVWLLPAHVVRFFPAYVAAKDAAAKGLLGEPRALELSRVAPFPGWGAWFADPQRSGGVVVDLAIHDLDIAHLIGGPVEEVRAKVTTGDDGAPLQRATVWLTHASGATSEITAAWDTPGTELRTTFRIAGAHGAVELDSAADDPLRWECVNGPPVVDLDRDPMVVQLEEFLDVINGLREPRVTAADGLAALTIALAAEQSATTGRAVNL